MRKIAKYAALITILLTLVMGNSLIATADEPRDAGSKIESLLALQVDAKLRQIEAGGAMPAGEVGVPQSIITGAAGPGGLQNQRIFIRFAQEPTPGRIAELEALGVTVYPETWIPPLENHPTGFVLADMPVDKLNDVATVGSVVSLSTAEVMLEPQNDRAAEATNVDDVWNGTPGYDGTGVTVAVLDSGFEIGHPDFPAMTPETDYKDYDDYPILDDTVANTVTGHGTHVAGTVLGRGTASASAVYKGAAYNATPKLLKIGDDSTGSASSDAMTYAIRAAVDTYNADVITISYGGWSTYHDGSDANCQAVDYAVSQGAVVLIAAGNEASDDEHYSGTVDAGSTTDFIQVNVSGAGTANTALAYNMVWYDGTGTNNDLVLTYYDPSKALLPSTNGSQSESPRGTESEFSYYYNVYLPPGSGSVYLKVQNLSGNEQTFHLYYDPQYNGSGAGTVKFDNPDANYTIGSPAEADGAIAVGAYTTRNDWYDYQNVGPWTYGFTEGQWSPFSSCGPRVDGADKPSVVAPGSITISCRDDDVYTWANKDAFYIDNDGPNVNDSDKNNDTSGDEARYYAMQGTSMACPHAAGVAALLLDKNPTWTPVQVRYALESTATDKGAGGRDSIYGWGLINALEALNASVPAITSCTQAGDEMNQFAPGQTVYVKGSGLEASTNYKVWIQDNPVGEGDTLIEGENPSEAVTPKQITTNADGTFGPTEIWAIPSDAPVTHDDYDIVVDKQGDDYTGKYNAASDGIDSVSAVGFVAPVPEMPTIILLTLGMVVLGWFQWSRMPKRKQQ